MLILLPCVRLFHCIYNCCLKFEETYFFLRCFFNFFQVLILGLSSLLLCFCMPSNHMAANLLSLILASLCCLSMGVSLNSKYLYKLASHSIYTLGSCVNPSNSAISIPIVLSSWFLGVSLGLCWLLGLSLFSNTSNNNAQRATIQNTKTEFWQQLQKSAVCLILQNARFNLFKSNISFNKNTPKTKTMIT